MVTNKIDTMLSGSFQSTGKRYMTDRWDGLTGRKRRERERKKTQKERVGGSWQGAGLIKNRSFNPVVFQTLASVRITWRAC